MILFIFFSMIFIIIVFEVLFMDEHFQRNRIDLIVSILIAVASTSVLALSLTGLSYFLLDETNIPNVTWLLFSLALLIAGINQILFVRREKFKIMKIDHFVNAGVLLILSALTGIFYSHKYILALDSVVYFSTLIVYMSLYLVNSHKPQHIVFALLCIGIDIFLLIGSCSGFEAVNTSTSVILFSMMISLLAVLSIMREAFAKIQLRSLTRVIQKTFAGEILLGLFFLITAFSFVFMLMEDIHYMNALWYCFSVITTIGFGDIVVTSPICRILTVVLGIYGIVVVAVITSVIINFYNETKDRDNSNKE